MSKIVQHLSRTTRIPRWVIATTLLSALVLVPAVVVAQAPSASNYKILHPFAGPPDGAYPAGQPLNEDDQGNLYGVTVEGGNTTICNGGIDGCGVVFKINKAGTEKVLYAFTGLSDGGFPAGGVLRDAAGNLYGTTFIGGKFSSNCSFLGFSGCGVVFKVDSTGHETVLHSFKGTDGAFPGGNMVRDAQGNFYGSASEGGNLSDCGGYGCGVIFKLDTARRMTTLYTFTGGTDGGQPGGVIRDAAGNLYGTAYEGGKYGEGVVFKLDTAGRLTTLYSFTGGTDGAQPQAGVVRDEAGNLYGVTFKGGDQCDGISGGCGVVFKVNKTGHETVLHSFEGPDGAQPGATVVRDAQGNLYGTASLGGKNNANCSSGYGCGTVFKLTPDGNGKWTETVLHAFKGGTDGDLPQNILLLDANGTLYGTTNEGGIDGLGTVFKLTP